MNTATAWEPITPEEGEILKVAVEELTDRLDDEGGGPSVEPEFHEVSEADYEFMVRKRLDLVMFGGAIQNVKKGYYQGTVPGRVKRARRAAGKRAKAARKLAR